MGAPARECSSPMRLFPKSGSQSSSPLDSTVSLTVGLILGATLLDNCRPCLFKVQQAFVSALLTQCFKDKDKCKDKNKRHSRWFPLKKFAPPKVRRCSNINFARWPVYKLAEQFPKKYSKWDKKKEEEKDRSDNYFASSAPSPLPPLPAKASPWGMPPLFSDVSPWCLNSLCQRAQLGVLKSGFNQVHN